MPVMGGSPSLGCCTRERGSTHGGYPQIGDDLWEKPKWKVVHPWCRVSHTVISGPVFICAAPWGSVLLYVSGSISSPLLLWNSMQNEWGDNSHLFVWQLAHVYGCLRVYSCLSYCVYYRGENCGVRCCRGGLLFWILCCYFLAEKERSDARTHLLQWADQSGWGNTTSSYEILGLTNLNIIEYVGYYIPLLYILRILVHNHRKAQGCRLCVFIQAT